jgi:hypothetical protein
LAKLGEYWLVVCWRSFPHVGEIGEAVMAMTMTMTMTMTTVMVTQLPA